MGVKPSINFNLKTLDARTLQNKPHEDWVVFVAAYGDLCCCYSTSLRFWWIVRNELRTYWYDIKSGLWTENRKSFFRSVFLGFSRPKADFFKSFFRLPQKTETEKPTGFVGSFFFPMSPTPITPTYLYWNLVCMDSPLAPADSSTRQSSKAPV